MVDNLSSVYESPIYMMGQKLNIQSSSIQFSATSMSSDEYQQKTRAKKFQILVFDYLQ